jgi:hypothetical protein
MSSDFIPYPTNRVAGTIGDADSARKAVEALAAAGIARDAIDVLHGEKDLRRLDPSGAEHGVFAQLQRSLIRAGSEIKHLNHHVEDVRAGRFVVMVLAPEVHIRDVVADILHAHGAEFVGFYGRWAYEALPDAAPQVAASTDRTYEISVDRDAVRVRTKSGTASIPEAAIPDNPLSQISPSMFLLSWSRKDGTSIAHVFDVDSGVAYTSLVTRDGVARHVKGTITPVK